MSLDLGYSYSRYLSKEKEAIDKRVSESRKEFFKSASDNFKFCLTVQSLY